MRHPIFTFLLGLAALTTIRCSFHMRNTTQVPYELRTLLLQSNDPYSLLTRIVRHQLYINNITVVDNKNVGANTNLPILCLSDEKRRHNTVSVFQNGVTAEYSIVMSVSAQVVLPQRGTYPINATVYRYFFDNPFAALAKDAEQNIILDEMRHHLAEQIIRKMRTVYISHLNDKIMLLTPKVITSGKDSP